VLSLVFRSCPDLNYFFVVITVTTSSSYLCVIRTSHFLVPIFERFLTTMAIDSDLNKVLSVLGLQGASKEAISKGFPKM
jgi:hypothetical protein